MEWADKGLVDEYSLASIPIEMMFQDQALARGTGFVWAEGETCYIVTNWHNVSGINPLSGKNLAASGARPNKIKAMCNDKNNIGKKIGVDFDLYQPDGNTAWLVHPERGKSVDIVAMRAIFPDNIDPRPINLMKRSNIDLQMGMDVFILGYPFDPSPSFLPVWKRGSIATEPAIIPQASRYLLVDTASRPGMSGSPVIMRDYGMHLNETKNGIIEGAHRTRLLGIYSGRLETKSPLDAELGLVWPLDFIREIALNGQHESNVFI